MIFALAFALFVFIVFFYQLWQVSASIFRCSCRHVVAVAIAVVIVGDDGSESLTQQSSLAPEATLLAPPAVHLLPLGLTHTSVTFVNGQNFCLPQDEFVYFSSMFALCFAALLSAFFFRFELFFVNVIIIFPVENVFL